MAARPSVAAVGKPRASSVRVSIARGTNSKLATRLVLELAEGWQRGEQPRADDFLQKHPQLGQDAEAAVQLIYEEICQRQEAGQEVDPAEVFTRYPEWRPQLEVLLECHRRLVEPLGVTPTFPALGETFAGFSILGELGRGAAGRVFLATQPALADRPIVLKLTPIGGQEHLSLARLQHTHIMPLYWMHDEPQRNLRALCMPYCGGSTLDRVLHKLKAIPPGNRTGRQLLDALDQTTGEPEPGSPVLGPVRRFLASASYADAVCWLGACLADALQYAHDRNLVHLDVKPSNVLLAADGQPMLLDFHLAHEPLRPDGPPVDWLGGTPGYMSPEQQAALDAVREGKPVPAAIDGRSDLYSLGLLLYELLGGTVPVPADAPPLRHVNPQVSVGLADIIARCLRPASKDRYADAAALAGDLRRHLTAQPLRGVRNRNLLEGWRKWRSRKPHALSLLVMRLVVFGAFLTAGVGIWSLGTDRLREAERALAEGRELIDRQQYDEAAQTLARGLDVAERLPVRGETVAALHAQLAEVQRAQAARELHALADRVRFLADGDSISPAQQRTLEDRCRAIWEARAPIIEHLATLSDPATRQRLQRDLLDLAMLWTDQKVRRSADQEAARRDALQTLAEAEKLCGPSPALDQERRRYSGAAEGPPPVAHTAWDHYTLGRSLLRSGHSDEAAAELQRAIRLEPQGFWPNFYWGGCAYRLGRYADAAEAFCVCVALAPEKPECHYNRALAYAALGRLDRAAEGYDRVLELDPTFAAAALNRGLLRYRQERYAEARQDLESALANGVNPAPVHYNLALIHLASKDRAAARASLQRALAADPNHVKARELYNQMISYRGHREHREATKK